MHNQIAEFVVHTDISTVNRCIEQFTDYKPILTCVYVDFSLRRESAGLWWFYAPQLYQETACGGMKLVSIPEGTLIRVVDFAESICKLALNQYVQELKVWVKRFGLLHSKFKETGFVNQDTQTLSIQKQSNELFVEDIDTFCEARNVQPQDVKALLPLDLSEDKIQTSFEEIIGENFHQNDWGGELNDLVTSHIKVKGQRIRAAFMLKGNGTKGKLTIAKCGQNGDQIVRLVDAPVDLYIIQHVGEIDQRVIFDLKSKVQLKIWERQKCQMCILDGTDTARILRAYEKI